MGSVVANSQTIVVVPGNAQLGLAGQSAGATYNGDTAPLNSPALASVALLQGQALRITASGLVSGFAPDGIDAGDSACGAFGIGRIFAKRGSLIGVFVAATIDSSANLPNVDYLVGGREVDVLTPILQQPFLIGSGQTPGGSVRTIVIPAQAARLYLGVAGFSTASLTGSFTAIISSVPAPGTLGNPVKVFGISQLALAGQPAGTSFHGDTAPLNSPVQVGIPLVAGQRIQITAGGNADGNIGANETTGGEFGIGQISAPRGSLIGVFLGDSVDSNISPPFADYTGGASNIPQMTPLLQQPFFLGSGTTSGGASRTIVVPAGATRLFLGTTGGSVAERSGSVLATATAADTSPGLLTETPIVSGHAQLGLAGQPDGRMYNGDSAPLNSPALSKLTLVPGHALQIAASGFAGGNAPDGATTIDSIGGALGISQIVAPQNSLIGVFLGAAVDPDAAPPKVDFSAGAREVGVLSPMLQQPFLIGAGTTLDGSNRTRWVSASLR
jgi:hypothetical protein